MARKKQPYNGLFDLGFPIHTRVGQDKVKSILYDLNENHAARVARVQDYLSRELDSVGNTTFSKVGSVLNHNAEDLARIRGNTDVRHTGVIMHAVARMMPIEQRTKERQGFFTPAATIQSTPGSGWDAKRKCWVGKPPPFFPSPPAPPNAPPLPFYAVGGAPDGCGFSAAAYYGSPTDVLFPLCLCGPEPSTGVVTQPITTPVTTPTSGSQCPQCGCPLSLNDLFNAPGSSCQQPLYIVLCAPYEPPTCPVPSNGEQTKPTTTAAVVTPTTPTVTPITPTQEQLYGAAQVGRQRFFGPQSAFKLNPKFPTAE